MPTADTVRPKLDSVLQQLRLGQASEWSEAEQRRWHVIFPQMCEWLPEDERELKRAEFRRLTDPGLGSEVDVSGDHGHAG